MVKIRVSVPVPTDKSFTYLSPESLEAGVRVKVPFGARKLIGVVLGPSEGDQDLKLREILEVIDEKPMLSPQLLRLAEWMSAYYLHPLGEVFKVMLPASKSNASKETYVLKKPPSPLYEGLIAHLFARQSRISKQTARKKLQSWPDPHGDAMLGKLVEMGVVEFTKEKLLKAKSSLTHSPAEGICPLSSAVPPLNDEQRNTVDAIEAQGFGEERKPFLLRGVTGSGKTRVYLSLIERVEKRFGSESQTLILVPEIALTPQTTRVFEESFPRQVAVVHSAMTDTQRWGELMRIHVGQARILVGPRSAVFAPFRSLKLVVVDEEHDGSYKQSSGLCYSGRDIAVVRARFEDALCVLGSATPSLESYHNAQTGKYHLLELSTRAVAVPMPKVHLIPSPKTRHRESIEEEDNVSSFLSEDTLSALREVHRRGKQAIVLVNRRGYAYYLLGSDQVPVQCPNCSISLTVHRKKTRLLCHYCGFQKEMQDILSQQPGAQFSVVGVGSQKAERFLANALPEARIARLDSDVVVSRTKLLGVLTAFREGRLDILVGTQILAKGHDFPNVALTVISEFDRVLDFPDFRAGERAFQLMVQAAGRAGRHKEQGDVFLQSNRSFHPLIRDALSHDYVPYALRELAKRQSFNFPPFAHLIRIELSCENLADLESACREIVRWQNGYFSQHRGLLKELKVLGPSAPPIERIKNQTRRALLLSSKRFSLVHQFARHFLSTFKSRLKGIKIQVDVDPQSLM